MPYNENGFFYYFKNDTGYFLFTRTGVVEGDCDSLIYLNLHIIENPNPPTSISNSSNFSTQFLCVGLSESFKNLSKIRIEGINDEVIVYLRDISGKTIAVLKKGSLPQIMKLLFHFKTFLRVCISPKFTHPKGLS
jgi:hypothetical protein